jgi:osmotically-inducible protein OsmY
MMKKIVAIILLFFATSCVETVIVGSAFTAVIVAREKSLSDTKTDIEIAVKIEKEFIKNNIKFSKDSIYAIVNEGKVLLVGSTEDKEKSTFASNLVWKIDGVKAVINEVQVVDKSSYSRLVSRSFRDSFLTLFIKTRIFFDKDISSLNYKITTVNKVVYIIGTAKKEYETSRVLRVTSKVKGVEKVVNYVTTSSEKREDDQPE